MKNKTLKLNKILLYCIFFLLLTLAHLIFLAKGFPVPYTYSEWLINYEGGFIRRGLGGQIVFIIVNYFNFDLRNVIVLIQFSGYFFFIFFLYKLFLKKIKFSFFWYLIFLNPIIFYPFYETEALGRKDIYVIAIFLIYALSSYKNILHLILSFCLLFSCSTLIHEITIFYIFHYLFITLVIVHLNFKQKFQIRYLGVIFILVILLLYLNFIVSKNADLKIVLESWFNHGVIMEEGSGAFSWIKPSFFSILKSTFDKIKVTIIFTTLFAYLINSLPIVYLINLPKTKLINHKYNLKNIFYFFFIITIPMYCLIFDWGRITYLNLNFYFIIIFFYYKNNLILKKELFLKLKLINIKKKIMIFILTCFLLSPGLTATNTPIKIPLIKTVQKTIKITIKNFLYSTKYYNYLIKLGDSF